MAERLKVVRLIFCNGFKKLPCFPARIEVLSIQNCSRDHIEELDIGELKKLKILDLNRSIIDKISGGTFGMLKGLRELYLENFKCTNLREVITDVGQLSSLKILRAWGVKEAEYEVPLGLQELYTSSRISNLSELLDLLVLDVAKCKDGFDIPTVSGLADEDLQASVWCKVSKLKSLKLDNTKINIDVAEDTSSGHYYLPSSLTSLAIVNCVREPMWLPRMENLVNLTYLRIVHIRKCLDGNLDGLQGLRSLQTLLIWSVKGLTRIKGLKDLLCSTTSKLRSLNIDSCPDLVELLSCELDDQTGVVPSLQKLEISNCQKLDVGPMIRSLRKFPMLKDLRLSTVKYISKEEELDMLGTLEELVYLELVLDDTSSLQRIASLSKLHKLTTLKVQVPSLREIEGLAELKSLQRLYLDGCRSLERLWPDDQQQVLSQLEKLNIRHCESLTVGPMIRSLQKCPMPRDLSLANVKYISKEEELGLLGTLEELVYLNLVLDDTSSLRRIASLSKLHKLTTLKVHVPSLREIEGLAELKSLQRLYLEGCRSLERLWPDDQQRACSLVELKRINIRGCKSLSVEHLSALKSSLPNHVEITWPNDIRHIEQTELCHGINECATM